MGELQVQGLLGTVGGMARRPAKAQRGLDADAKLVP